MTAVLPRIIAFSLGVLLLWVTVQRVSAEVPARAIYQKVLMIKAHDLTGTAFTIEVDERQYLVTAKHVTAGLKDEDTIHMRRGERWVPLKVSVMRCTDPIDIAVLVPPTQLTATFPLELTMKNIIIGQDVYFLGFPYALFTRHETVNGLLPFPFVKRGIVSASHSEGDVSAIFVDGHNNPGFSGGPIVFRDLYGSGRVARNVMAVVSGFRHEYTPVLQPQPINPEEVTPEDIANARILNKSGHLFRLTETEQLVRLNSGIVIGYNISHAVDLIRQNPIGPKVSTIAAQ